MAESIPDDRFGDLAVRKGYLSPGQLQEALRIQDELKSQGEKKRLGVVCIERGFITSDQMEDVLGFQALGYISSHKLPAEPAGDPDPPAPKAPAPEKPTAPAVPPKAQKAPKTPGEGSPPAASSASDGSRSSTKPPPSKDSRTRTPTVKVAEKPRRGCFGVLLVAGFLIAAAVLWGARFSP